jgi:hypothetical protein
LLPLQLRPLRPRQLAVPAVDTHAAVAAGDSHLDDLVWPLHGQAAQPHRVEELEDRAVGADAQRQRGDRHDREPGVGAHLAQRQAQVLAQAIEPRDRVHVVNLLPDTGEVAELAASGVAGVVRRHAARHVVRRFDLQVGRELTGTFPMPARASQPPRQAHGVTPRPAGAPG